MLFLICRCFFAEMKKIVTYAFAFLMTGLILGFTSGISYYVHQCNASHSRETSLFTPEFGCCPEDNECGSEGGTQNGQTSNSITETPCCITSYNLIQLAPSFVPEKISKLIPLILPFTFPVMESVTLKPTSGFTLYNHKPPDILQKGQDMYLFCSSFLL